MSRIFKLGGLLMLAVMFSMAVPTKALADWLSVTRYSQRDDRWKNNVMRPSTCTLGGYGCLTTCVAMAYTGIGNATNPGALCTWLSNNGGYNANGDLDPWKAAAFDGPNGLRYGTSGTLPLTALSVNAGMDRGGIYIVRSTRFSQHWVLVVGITQVGPNTYKTWFVDPYDAQMYEVGTNGVQYGAAARIYLRRY